MLNKVNICYKLEETELVEEWNEMKKFGDWLIGHGISCAEGNGNINNDDKIWEQRVGVILVHQAAEILMKAYLVKKGEIKPNKKIKFMHMFDKINFSEIDKNKFEKFNRIRNKVYHHSVKIIWDKNNEIEIFLEEFKNLYYRGFGEHLNYDRSSMKEKFKEIHK